MAESISVPHLMAKQLMRASWAVAAPALVPLVILMSVDQVNILAITGMGRLGVAAIAVLFFSLAFLFWRGRWWAGIPSLAVFFGAVAWFTVKFVRPLMAYFAANPIRGLEDFLRPLGMVAFHLVVVLITLTLGLVVWKGIKTCREIEPRPVSGLFWGIASVWALVLVGDVYYQKTAWREFNVSSDLMVRLCLDDPDLQKEARERLLKVGAEAVPDLLMGVAAPDADLECLRQQSRKMLLALGQSAGPGLLDAALKGDIQALRIIRQGKLAGASKALREHLKDPKRKSSPAYTQELKMTLKALDPGDKLD